MNYLILIIGWCLVAGLLAWLICKAIEPFDIESDE